MARQYDNVNGTNMFDVDGSVGVAAGMQGLKHGDETAGKSTNMKHRSLPQSRGAILERVQGAGWALPSLVLRMRIMDVRGDTRMAIASCKEGGSVAKG